MGNLNDKKVLVIGLDGETYRVINPLIQQGQLPNLKRLMDGGSHGILMSTLPPVTAPAWTTFMTGKNPGKHGIYSFMRFDYDEGKVVPYDRSKGYPVNARSITDQTIWEILTNAGKRLISVNMPMTYPPRKVNGMMISCFFTPPGARDYTYPPDLVDTLGDYEIDVDFGYGFGQFGQFSHDSFEIRKVIPAFRSVLEKRTRTALRLMRENPWDLFAICFTETDRLHHLLWKYADPSCASYRDRLAEQIRDDYEKFYGQLDDAIGELVKAAGDQTETLIMSDHGFRASPKKHLLLNAWLYQNDYLKLEGMEKPLISFPLRRWLRRFLGDRLVPPRRDSGPVVEPRVNWNGTKAWAESLLAGTAGIRVNLEGKMARGCVRKGREYDRICRKLIEAISEIRDPETGRKVIRNISKREKVYHGPHLDQAPDLMMTLEEDYDLPLLLTQNILGKECIVPADDDLICGTHEAEGIAIFSGPRVQPQAGQSEPHSIEDIAPTVLHLLDVPIPDDMDGKVLQEVLQKSYLNDHPIRYQKPNSPPGRPVGGSDSPETGWSSEQDAEKIKERLRNLGYL